MKEDNYLKRRKLPTNKKGVNLDRKLPKKGAN